MGTNKAEGKRSLKEMEDEEDQEEEEDNENCDNNNGGLGFVNEQDKKKKGKMGSGNSGSMVVVFCQAENCGADMTDAKKYHKRHKVCEIHFKAPYVLVNGTQQRFCQQCSRFHELSEFDENKRSCRMRLAGHNERRRKSTYDCHGEASN